MKRPFKDWNSQSSLIAHYGTSRDPEVLDELALRARERGAPVAEVTPEFVAAVAADEARRPFAPALN